MVIIELPKFKLSNVTEKKLTGLWLRFLAEMNASVEYADSSLLEVPEIKKALSLLETSAYTKAELAADDRNWDAIRTKRTLFHGAFKEGYAQGLAIGRAKWLAKDAAKCTDEVI